MELVAGGDEIFVADFAAHALFDLFEEVGDLTELAACFLVALEGICEEGVHPFVLVSALSGGDACGGERGVEAVHGAI